ncbi:hypothetical protein [Psychrobacter aestuarii]|uniref:hypothetical protein n=1 Tax=Psychrobacter aestuarii TaxID=556327 RepID=UPI00191A85CE|nr:hypothetical protein [Psychrobacter aestuarii]
MTHWYQNKPAPNNDMTSDAPAKAPLPQQKAQPNRHLLMSSQVLLPEGNHWSEIIDNTDDVTQLNRSITDTFGLPLLTKPITEIEEALPLQTVDGVVPSDTLTERLWALIYTQLSQHDEALQVIGEHLLIQTEQHIDTQTTTSIHPEWQQTDSLHMQQESSAEATEPAIAILELYLCLPADSDKEFLRTTIQSLMTEYGIHAEALKLQLLSAEPVDNTPLAFISDVLCSVADSNQPRVGMLLIADTQIDQDWLDNESDRILSEGMIPTEAASTLMFCNPSAAQLLAFDAFVPIHFTATTALPMQVNTADDQRLRYKQLLPKAKQTLLQQNMLPQTTADVEHHERDDTEQPLVLISDLNVVQQAGDMDAFFKFTDDLAQQSFTVNAHHLGHHMPTNPWLTCFMPICLLTQYANDFANTEETLLAVIRHPTCCSLWQANAH